MQSIDNVLLAASIALACIIVYENIFHRDEQVEIVYLSAMARENKMYHVAFTIVILMSYCKKIKHFEVSYKAISVQEFVSFIAFISTPLSDIQIINNLHTLFLFMAFTYNFMWHISSLPKQLKDFHFVGWLLLYFCSVVLLLSLDKYSWYSVRQSLVLAFYLYGNLLFT